MTARVANKRRDGHAGRLGSIFLLHPQPHGRGDVCLNTRINLRERANRPGNRAGGHFVARAPEALAAAIKLA